MPSSQIDVYDEAALLERLTTGVKRADRPAVFLLGSAITAPCKDNVSGVPGVDGIIELIRNEFDDRTQRIEFEKAISSGDSQYQAAFLFLLGRRGQQAANDVIKHAVWKARKPVFASGTSSKYLPSETTSDDFCRTLDSDYEGWLLTPSVAAIGHLVSDFPDRFGRALLTTNFDPLLEVAIVKSGGHFFRTVLHRDGNLGQTEGTGCHVIHLHGYWYGSDTLHTPRQLRQPRPRLKASLASLIKGKTLVVSGYGGWDDTFTEALMEVVLDDAAFPEIIWTFHTAIPAATSELIQRLAPGIDRGRVSLYTGIDCHAFFPILLRNWEALEPPPPRVMPAFRPVPIHSFSGHPSLGIDSSIRTELAHTFEESEQDRPPLVDVCVGRERELRELRSGAYRLCFITGFGGQGKSTVAAQHFATAHARNQFDYYIWRDCKEEGERFENQLIAVIERLSDGRVSGNELSKQPISALTELFIRLSGRQRILLVFDNVDHYVDLECNTLTGNAGEFVDTFLSMQSSCKVIFTCRPLIQYKGTEVLSLKIEGLDLDSAVELFSKRGAPATYTEIEEAHGITRGHAFWLDLLAAQIAKRGANLRLSSLLEQISAGGGEIPTATLQSIWRTLRDREMLVLRTMAEAVRPETETHIGDYLRGTLSFSKVMGALRSLRSLNLIVVKPRQGQEDVLELHPLVREFIRRSFQKPERMTFIDAIIQFYSQLIGMYKPRVSQRPPLSILQNWTENAELYVEAGQYQNAFNCLAEVTSAFWGSDFPGEFVRSARILFSSIEWKDHDKYDKFDSVFNTYIDLLANLGRAAECGSLLDQYAATVRTKDARYINYCNLRCYANWVAKNYTEAIMWGERGKKLRSETNVDTVYSTDHNLALAQRDSGMVDPALTYFLGGRQLAEVLDPEDLDEARGGVHYGNIGRCLHLMGQIDPALICYRKSAILLEKGTKSENVFNQGFVRKWIGELLIMRGEVCTAKTFLDAAKEKWNVVSPPGAREVDEILTTIEKDVAECAQIRGENIERFCVAWIFGREVEFKPI